MFKVQECLPATIKEYPTISKELMKGSVLHAFRSGGGLRVVTIKHKDEKVGYGEHPYIYNALDYTEEDLIDGGLSYTEVYGKKYPHYMTGAQPSGGLDCWVFAGRSFDILFKDEKFKFSSQYTRNRGISNERFSRILKTGVMEEWTEDGLTFRSEPMKFANGEPSVSTKFIGENNSYEKIWVIEKRAEFSADTLKDLFFLLDRELPKIKEQT